MFNQIIFIFWMENPSILQLSSILAHLLGYLLCLFPLRIKVNIVVSFHNNFQTCGTENKESPQQNAKSESKKLGQNYVLHDGFLSLSNF